MAILKRFLPQVPSGAAVGPAMRSFSGGQHSAGASSLSGMAWMTSSLCFHYGSYEWVRNAAVTSALYNKDISLLYWLQAGTGIMSFVWFQFYHSLLVRYGPHRTLRITLFVTSFVWFLLSWFVQQQQPSLILTAFLYLFQSTYHSLLYEQQWSYLTSIVHNNSTTSASSSSSTVWYGRITAIGLAVSTLTAQCTPLLLAWGNQSNSILLRATSVSLLVSAYCAHRAYQNQKPIMSSKPKNEANKQTEAKKTSMFQTVRQLFGSNRTLQALLLEAVAFAAMVHVGHVQFVQQISQESTRDTSNLLAQFYTLLNASSFLWQIVGLPLFISKSGAQIKKDDDDSRKASSLPSQLWNQISLVPLIVFGIVWILQRQSSFALVSSTHIILLQYGVLKFMEYALRSVMLPTVYQRLDWQARYIGKEAIGIVATRWGKSILAILSAIFLARQTTGGASTGLVSSSPVGTVSVLLWGTYLLWFLSTRFLARSIPTAEMVN